MLKTLFYVVLIGSFGACRMEKSGTIHLKEGVWRLVMHSPGGELPFTLKILKEEGVLRAEAHNQEEILRFDTVWVDETGSVTLGMDHYESTFKGQLSPDGTRIDGQWTKVTGHDKISKLDFHAEYNNANRFQLEARGEPASFAGKWSVTFDNEGDPQPAIAEFSQDGSHIQGTFLTPTGDYRYLDGSVAGNKLYLSCFDGGHAFLFTATLQEDGSLSGDFWSKDTWHETWTAVPDEHAELEDSFQLTALKEGAPGFRFQFPDMDGEQISQDHPSLNGKVRLITIFGSWCPNCNDEAPFLQGLYEKYADQGFEVLGLAFEMTRDEARNIKVLNRFKKKHNLSYRILLAGVSTDKEEAARTLPDLQHVMSFPTTILIDRNGQVNSIHTGFTGPGTGQHFHDLKKAYQQKIEALLKES